MAGTLTIKATTGDETLPVSGATVTVRDNGGGVLYTGTTDESGNVGPWTLTVPPNEYTQSPGYGTRAYSTYNVTVDAPGYNTVQINGVEMVNDASYLPVHMHPLAVGRAAATEVINIPPPEAALPTVPQEQRGDTPIFPQRGTAMAAQYNTADNTGSARGNMTPTPFIEGRPNPRIGGNPVCIPDKVRVHLGTPSNTAAQTVTVPFIDYIKNVVSSEIYSTWPTASIDANIHAIVSFVLNRVYSEWYPSRGYNYDITNNTAYDQKYIHGRNIFQTVSDEVDKYFDTYARRVGFANPYFTEYCNGTTATCAGMSQWGSESLARQGYTPIQILHYYYPDDLELVQAECRQGISESYPGTALTIGSSGADVQRIQNFLNRIRANYPAIPQITNPNGYYGADTANAVKKFQEVFNVGFPDGIVGPATWNKITSLYTGIIKVSELNGEGERVGLAPNPPTTTISQGSRGADAAHLQYILDFLGKYYEEIPTFIKDSYFGPSTKNAVIAFQKMAGLTPDGIVGPATWQALYRYYRGIGENTPPLPSNPTYPESGLPEYPGKPLREGDTGTLVRGMQEYLNYIHGDYPNIPLVNDDGVFGPATTRAVVAFQRQFGLTPDGIIGPATWDKILQEYLSESAGVGVEPGSPVPPTPTVPTYPGTPLQVGSRGDSVRQIQRCLGIAADGIYGTATRNAVAAFQRNHGLTGDGIVGPYTWRLIMDNCGQSTPPTTPTYPAYPGTLLGWGARGENVKRVQQCLGITADGIFGQATYNAVIAFQRNNGLTADGIVGPKTWDAIMRACGA